MPFCPDCRAEYEADVTRCADCGVALVDSLPDEAPDPDVELAELCRAQGEIDAQLVRSVLEASGVESMLSGESVRLTHGLTVDGLAVVKVLVREEDLDRAREAIAASERLRDCGSCGEPNPSDATRCRLCGAPTE